MTDFIGLVQTELPFESGNVDILFFYGIENAIKLSV